MLCWMCREEAAEPSPCSLRRFYRKQTQLWLQNYGNLSYFLLTCLSSHPCSVGVAGSEVSSGAGSCWGVLWARQGTAVRFGKRNPTGFCKQHSLCAPGECSQGICPKLLAFSRKDGFFQQVGQCFPDIGDPSCIWLQGPEVKLLSGETFH